jgi:hypothetical protein
MDYNTNQEQQFGTVITKSEWIKGALVFTETGYGVKCNTARASVEWRNPVFRCSDTGEYAPENGTANYNGTCTEEHNTQQCLISKSPLQWFHATNSYRTVNPNDRLW